MQNVSEVTFDPSEYAMTDELCPRDDEKMVAVCFGNSEDDITWYLVCPKCHYSEVE